MDNAHLDFSLCNDSVDALRHKFLKGVDSTADILDLGCENSTLVTRGPLSHETATSSHEMLVVGFVTINNRSPRRIQHVRHFLHHPT